MQVARRGFAFFAVAAISLRRELLDVAGVYPFENYFSFAFAFHAHKENSEKGEEHLDESQNPAVFWGSYRNQVAAYAFRIKIFVESESETARGFERHYQCKIALILLFAATYICGDAADAVLFEDLQDICKNAKPFLEPRLSGIAYGRERACRKHV